MEVLRYSPKLLKGYRLKELIYQLVDFYNGELEKDPEKLWNKVMALATEQNLTSVTKTLKLNREEIFNNFAANATKYKPEQII